MSATSTTGPVTWEDVLAARRRIAPYLPVTALRRYAATLRRVVTSEL